jgi:sugar phosphate isomerase/epimerase
MENRICYNIDETKPEKMEGKSMRKGVQAFTVRDFLNDREQCRESYKKIADIGYDCVQTWAPPFMPQRELKDMLKEFYLTNCSGGGDFEQMKAGGKAIAEAVAGARLFDTAYICVGTIPVEYRYTQDGVKRYAHSLNAIAAELKKEGCSLMYHHHALEFYSFGGGLHGMDILTQETDPESVLFMLDTHWLVSGGVNPATWIRKMKGRIPIIHFKDYSITVGAEKIEDVVKTFAEIGEGNIDWPPVVDACRDAGVEYVIVEQDTCKGDPFDSIRISYENMCKLGI